MDGHRISMLGTGLISDFYTNTLHGQRGRDQVQVVYSRSEGARGGVQGALVDPGVHDGPQGGRGAPRHGRRDRGPAQLPARGGGRAGGGGRQGGPLHEAARADGRGSQADARDGRVGRRLRRLPRGPVLHAQDAQGDRVGPGRGDRRRHLGPVARDPSRAPLGLVLGRPADRRRRDHRPWLPLHRDRPQLRRQGQPAGRGPVPHGHPGPPDRRRGQRGRADQVRVRRDRPVRGQLDVPRRDGPARRGRRHARHDLDEPLPADRVRDVQRAGRRRRLRRREGRVVRRLAVPGRRRGLRARLRRHVQRHVPRDRRRLGRRRRPSTTAMS